MPRCGTAGGATRTLGLCAGCLRGRHQGPRGPQFAVPPPLVILDWSMPGADSDALPRDSLQSGPGLLYVILLTANDTRDQIVAGLAEGADEYITKPFDWRVLRARLKTGARIAALQQRLAQRVDELQRALTPSSSCLAFCRSALDCKGRKDDGDYWQQSKATSPSIRRQCSATASAPIVSIAPNSTSVVAPSSAAVASVHGRHRTARADARRLHRGGASEQPCRRHARGPDYGGRHQCGVALLRTAERVRFRGCAASMAVGMDGCPRRRRRLPCLARRGIPAPRVAPSRDCLHSRREAAAIGGAGTGYEGFLTYRLQSVIASFYLVLLPQFIPGGVLVVRSVMIPHRRA